MSDHYVNTALNSESQLLAEMGISREERVYWRPQLCR